MLPMDAGRHVLGGAGFDFLSCPLRPDCRETVPVRGVALAVHAVLQHLEGVDGGVTGPPPRPRLYSCLGDVDVASREISKREPERAKGGIRSAVARAFSARHLVTHRVPYAANREVAAARGTLVCARPSPSAVASSALPVAMAHEQPKLC
jgi:hypothetical protein